MTFANYRAAAEHNARTGTITPHQLAAWEAAWEAATDEQRQLFTDLWRAQGSPARPGPEPGGELVNLQSWLTFLTGPEVSRLSRNKISPLTVAEACGFIGCVIVETGRPLLDRLDVVEVGSGAGRGAMQYTGVRRTAYDKARSAAIAKGVDPGSNSWQQLYFAEEYAGLHDPPQGSLIGWTRVFENRPAGMDAARAAAYFSERYFRPGVPHLDRRQAEARRVWGLVQSGRLTAARLPSEPGLTRTRAEEVALLVGQEIQQGVKVPNHLRLTRTGDVDRRGLELLRLEFVVDRIPMEELLVVSGAPGRQGFRRGQDSRAGSLEPLPEGRYRVGDIEWKGGKDVYAGSWGAGLGPVWVGIEYESGTTARSALGIHLDENQGSSPGTAGCVGIRSMDELKRLVSLLRKHDPKLLFVDWKLGTCPPVKPM
jgi:hypothetical protein